MTQELANQCAIVTGASQGLGFEIARCYLAAGANLAICARNEVQLNQALATLKRSAVEGQTVIAVPADVSSQSEVSALVDAAIEQLGHVDILVNNAGIIGPAGPIESSDWQEWLRTIEINLLGSILLCRAVLPHLKQRQRGKIIQISGGGATSPMPGLSAYAVSKAAIVRFVETLAEETRTDSIDVNAIAPGVLDTRMLDQMLAAGAEKIGGAFYERLSQQKKNGATPLQAAADLAVFLGSAASNGISGKLLSAVWDPWTTLSGHVAELNSTDVYTLRRIVPRDRGFTWGDMQ
jgi:NAD(P)-dependent dehydrogenase (short-subunit alcohol dehydrogenase family)